MKAKQFVLVNGRFYGQKNGDGLKGVGIIIEGNRIVDVCHESKIRKSIPRVDMQGCIVAPGFIDLLVNGAGCGAFGVTADYGDLRLMADTQIAEGTTGFLAAAPSNTQELYLEMQHQVAEHQNELPKNLLGIHLEGPYLSRDFRGAHREDCVRQCTDSELRELLDKENHFVRLITVAPECINTEQLNYLHRQGVKVSFGHSGVDYDTALRFFEETGCSVTHLYNGMPPMHHRRPGHIPAIFRAKPMTGIIVDGVHVSYEMVRMAYEFMPESLYLFTDRFTDCAAMNVSYDSAQDCFVRTAVDGRNIICGSALSMMKAVRNCVEHVGISLKKAVQMASYYPAKVLGIDKNVGLLEPGYMANLVVFDNNWQVQRVMMNGTWTYER